MTIKERIDEALASPDLSYESDSLDKLIAVAFYFGAEAAAKRICDEHNRLASEAIEKAQKIRYWKQAINIMGDLAKPIYDPNYAQDMTDTFGDDETNL